MKVKQDQNGNHQGRGLIYIGCCGFAMSRSKYFKTFNVVELQETFYDPPNTERLRKLRTEAPPDFAFTMKCWQAITHPLDSPSWRRSKVRLDPSLKDLYGFLRPTKEVLKAWELVVEGAKALDAKVIIVQTPPSFNYNEENFKNVVDFFTAASASQFAIGWEPRGNWSLHRERIAEVLGRFKNVIHVVDPLKQEPVTHKHVAYFRLHGLNGELNYRYRYSDEDLQALNTIVKKYETMSEAVYVMFNNVHMTQDAIRFKNIRTANP